MTKKTFNTNIHVEVVMKNGIIQVLVILFYVILQVFRLSVQLDQKFIL